MSRLGCLVFLAVLHVLLATAAGASAAPVNDAYAQRIALAIGSNDEYGGRR